MNTEKLKARLLSKVVPGEGGCWIWTGALLPTGYGQMWNGSKPTSAHRLSYELRYGPIPKGLQIDHLCRVRRCIRPDHMEAVTARENWLRGKTPSRLNMDKTHCLRGHLFEGHNVMVQSRGGRNCRECHNLRARTPEYKRRRNRARARHMDRIRADSASRER